MLLELEEYKHFRKISKEKMHYLQINLSFKQFYGINQNLDKGVAFSMQHDTDRKHDCYTKIDVKF